MFKVHKDILCLDNLEIIAMACSQAAQLGILISFREPHQRTDISDTPV